MTEQLSSPGLLRLLGAHYQAARDGNLPYFPGGVRASTPLNAAPFLIDLARFRQDFGTGAVRSTLLGNLDMLLDALRAQTLTPLFLLVGGSFADVTRDPKDMDVVLYYASGEALPDGALKTLQKQAMKNGVDVRLMPYDSAPSFVAKTIGFFTLLYSQSRAPGVPSPILIVDLPAPPTCDARLTASPPSR